ncbi:hypothetical protein [Streptomyces aidingensis]|uniref:Uncharacterized protein n=1 Tax=Streptomyces aidingensis TaxID=910347 RepID=A0A1I1GX53_9ACTN|nr:hypothetical protein [Streptomyces aidingensis]SFC14438.1 hypothetical protein SAMN05421773_102115 [Streptomyces aidingensis]
MRSTSRHQGTAVVAAAVAVAFAAAGLTGCEDAARSPSADAAQESAEAENGKNDGTAEGFGGDAGELEVGTEVRPGLYVSTGNEFCFWRRDNGGDVPVASDAPVGTSYVRIDGTDLTFTTEGCGDWRPVPEPARAPEGGPARKFPGDAGVLLIGVDIAPGVYLSTGNDEDCFFQTMTDASHEWQSLGEPGVVAGDGTARIDATEEGTFLRTMGCQDWAAGPE